MGGGNPLVAEAPADDGGAFTDLDSVSDATDGLKFIDGGADAADAFARGDWIEGTVNGLSAGIDVVGAVLDPIGSVASMVAGWFIEHIGPIQEWLDQMLGDPDSIQANSETWHNISGHLTKLADQYGDSVTTDLGAQQGLTMDSYREYAQLQAGIVRTMSTIADGTGAGVALAGTVLAGVRDFICGITADLVGQLVKVVAESVFSLGIAAPHALATAANKCRELIARCRRFMDDLARSLDNMGQLAGRISPALEDGATTLARISRRAGSMNEYELSFLTEMTKAGAGQDDNSPYPL